jgi:predicted nucleic-acid-binding Zn-ribbon protein
LASTSNTEVKCVKCKNLYDAEVIDHVTLDEDRELIKSLRTGKANRVQCPKCKKVMYLDRSIVINFEPENRIVVFDPGARSKAEKDQLVTEFKNVISFNETLSEIGEETEFSVVSKLDELKGLLNEYSKAHS